MLKGDEGLPELFDSGKGFRPQQILLEQADEALGTAVALGRRMESRAFKSAMIDADKDIGLPFVQGDCCGRIGAPQ